MRNLFLVAILSLVSIAQQPADFEAAIDGLGLEIPCGTPYPLCLPVVAVSPTINFNVVTGANIDYFDLFFAFQPCQFFGFATTQFGIIDIDIGDPSFSLLYSGYANTFNGAMYTANFSVPSSVIPPGLQVSVQALVADATHPFGARLTNSMCIY